MTFVETELHHSCCGRHGLSEGNMLGEFKGFFSLGLEEWEFLEQTFSEAALWKLLGIQEHLWREELMEH